MRKLLLGGAAFAALAAGPAVAADLPVRAPIYKSPPPAVYTWTGFYGGVNIGYSWGRQKNDYTLTDPINGTFAFSESQRVDGVVGGIQWGYNWQLGNYLIGTETDIQASGQKGSTTYCAIPACTTSVLAEHKLPWFGTSRARFGVLVTPYFLLYATGGLAYGQVKADYTLVTGALTAATTNFRDTRAGGTVGAGIEGAFGNGWSAKLEYLYVDLGSLRATATTFNGAGAVVSQAVFNSRFTDNILRVGLNYKLGGGIY